MRRSIGTKRIISAALVLILTAGCMSGCASSQVAERAGQIMERASDKDAPADITDGITADVIAEGIKKAQVGWSAGQTVNAKADSDSPMASAADAVGRSSGSTVVRPVESDFKWFWERGTKVPAGATVLSGKPLGGNWKTMAFAVSDNGEVGYYSLFNSEVKINGNSSSLTADWYVSYSFWMEDGEEYYWFDESADADVKYSGKYVSDDNTLVVWDDACSFMFINTDNINGFMIDSWYQYDNKQYATGSMYNADDEYMGMVAMVRDLAAGTAAETAGSSKGELGDFLYTWWEEGGDWKDKTAIMLDYDKKNLYLSGYSYGMSGKADTVSDYTVDGNILRIRDKRIGDADMELKSKDRLVLTMGGMSKTYLREDDESVRLHDYIGTWYGVYNGTEGCSVVSYYGGMVYYGDYSMNQMTNIGYLDSAAAVNTYKLDSGTLTLYDASFRGGSVALHIIDATHMKTVNGEGGEMSYELLDHVNLIQEEASEKPKMKGSSFSGLRLGY